MVVEYEISNKIVGFLWWVVWMYGCIEVCMGILSLGVSGKGGGKEVLHHVRVHHVYREHHWHLTQLVSLRLMQRWNILSQSSFHHSFRLFLWLPQQFSLEIFTPLETNLRLFNFNLPHRFNPILILLQQSKGLNNINHLIPLLFFANSTFLLEHFNDGFASWYVNTDLAGHCFDGLVVVYDSLD